MGRYYTGNDGPVAIHTDAPEQVVMDLVRSFEQPYIDLLGEADSPGVATDYGHGIDVDGQPDCFYGWGEPQHREPARSRYTDGPSPCVPHFILGTINNKEYDPAAVAVELIRLGYQAVITDDQDWSKVMRGNEAPIRYHADHDH